MEAVNAFNLELFSMFEMKPPISRAKMISVTKSALRAVKFYKHVVLIVEKFIKRCKPELKVPGLYVVDSIIRQSRHQFGVDKDVFGPRFLKNFTDTFQNIILCPENDKTKVIRVLNLWQKSRVFELDIIQPLMEMANTTVELAPALEVPPEPQPEIQPSLVNTAPVVPSMPQLPSADALAAVAQLFQTPGGQELQRVLQNIQQADKALAASISNNTQNNMPNPAQVPLHQPNAYSAHTERKSSIAQTLLDRFDYDDEPEDVPPREGSVQQQGVPPHVNMYHGQMPNAQTVQPHMMAQTEHDGGMNRFERHMIPDGPRSVNDGYSSSQGRSRDDYAMRREGRHRGYSRRSRSRSNPRSPRRRRSSSRSRRPWHQGSSRSRSRDRHRRSRSRSQDRSTREKERERRQKGLPSIKSQTLSVCTTTLWVGQLDKKTTQSDVATLLEEFGQIESIHMIPPRGCAYIVMVHRQDAYTALSKLSRGSFKVNQKPIKIAWALNKGIKPAHKKLWDVERGVTYIPWNKVKVEELESYREGGVLDPETLNPEWNNAMNVNMNGLLPNVPADGAIAAHAQVGMADQATPIGNPLAFPGSIMLPVPSMHAGGGGPFSPTDFDQAKMGPGGSAPENPTKDAKAEIGAPSDVCRDNQLGSPAAPVMTLQGPGVMPGPRPGMPPLQPTNMLNPHLPPFLSAPNMPTIPPQMMPGAPMFPPGRFRLPLPFPPRGPAFQQHTPMGPEGVNHREAFQNGRPGLGGLPFQRGGW